MLTSVQVNLMYRWIRLGSQFTILSAMMICIAFVGKLNAKTTCDESEIGWCFERYLTIPSVVEYESGYIAVGFNENNIDILRVDSKSNVDRMPMGLPDFYQKSTHSNLRVEEIVRDQNGTAYVIGSVSSNTDGKAKQVGFIGSYGLDGKIQWSDEVGNFDDETGVYLYAAEFDERQNKLLIVGRETNGSDRGGKCIQWAQAVVYSVDPDDLSELEHWITWGEAAPGFRNRKALYDISPAKKEGQFVVAGFTSNSNQDGSRCQDDTFLALLEFDQATGFSQIKQHLPVDFKAQNELILAVEHRENEDYLVAGQGTDVNTQAKAALRGLMSFSQRDSTFDFDRFPLDEIDKTGGDRYRAIARLAISGGYIFAGSGSSERRGLNQGLWKVVDSNLETKELNYLTMTSGSDIEGLGATGDGRVFAVGTSRKNGRKVGWMGFIHDERPILSRREPEKSIKHVTNREIESGVAKYSIRDLINGIEVRNSNIKSGGVFKIEFIIDEIERQREVHVLSHSSTGDIDLALANVDSGEIHAFSKNAKGAGEYLAAQLQPGTYQLNVVAITDVEEYDIRLTTERPYDGDILNQLSQLSQIDQKRLANMLAIEGYNIAGNVDITLAGDTINSLAAIKNTINRNLLSIIDVQNLVKIKVVSEDP